jgi:hypothetical protein
MMGIANLQGKHESSPPPPLLPEHIPVHWTGHNVASEGLYAQRTHHWVMSKQAGAFALLFVAQVRDGDIHRDEA